MSRKKLIDPPNPSVQRNDSLMLNNGEGIDLCCLWEAMLDAYQRDKDDATPMARCWQDMGAFEMRQYAVNMVKDLNKAWEIVTSQIEDAMIFDWEFCPVFIANVWWTFSETENATFVQINHDPERIAASILAARALNLQQLG